jgi:predicted TIM-barrel fold metal-dependent hydrolase
MSAEKLTIVSGDSHATLLPGDWEEYVEQEYHYLLPQFHADNEAYTQLMGMFNKFPPEVLEIIDADGAFAAGGVGGAWDLDLRLAEMDRDGVAAEMVYPGDSRAIMPLTPIYRRYPLDVVAAGNRAYHRWLADTMGKASDRLLLVGDPTQAVGMDGILAELKWMAEHDFVGTSLPNPFGREQPNLYHEYWDPYWAACAEYGLTVVVHAGYGGEQAEFMSKLNGIKERMLAAGETDLINAIINNAEGFFSLDLRPRRAMWQLMLGGVFDRHPDFRLMLAEIRADWMPATLAHLDAAFDERRDELPAERRPSEYWRERCLTSLSFVHKAEVDMRHEIGVETVIFGRDYPHTEGTWPNTADWMSDAFAGVPEDELRMMLGENAIRFFGLDAAKLDAIAARIGPTVEEVTAGRPDLDERLVANWDTRGGYLKPAETPNPEAVDELLEVDLAALAGAR